MKTLQKLLSVTLVLVIFLSLCLSVSAVEKPESIFESAFKAEIFKIMGWDVEDEDYAYFAHFGYNADGTVAPLDSTPDYVVANVSYAIVSDANHMEYIGNYLVESNVIHYPYELGYHIYSVKDDELYTLGEAYEAGLPGVEFVLSVLGEKKFAYRDVFFDHIGNAYEEYQPQHMFYNYKELYSYYGESTSEEATPDFMLIAGYGDVAPAYSYGVFGDYIVHTGHYIPYCLSYYVIDKNAKVYTLREAYEAKLEGIETVFTEYGLGQLLGDVDKDRILTIKDATRIQKCIAGIDSFTYEDEIRGIPEIWGDSHDEYVRFLSDFNDDDERNIKDVTAIQKHIAGLEY